MFLKRGEQPIAGYRLEKFLGRGNYGQVWKARAPGDTFCVLKFVTLTCREGWQELRGIQQVKEIRHTHVMPIIAVWVLAVDGTLLADSDLTGGPVSPGRQTLTADIDESNERSPSYLVFASLLGDKNVMQLLQERLGQRYAGIPLHELLPIMQQAGKAIDYLNSPAHDLGEGPVPILHCDIKPENLLMVGDSVAICDFSLARMLGPNGTSRTTTGMIGSPAYMAPECMSGRSSRTSDQYSLAVTYAHLRTGQLPFRDPSSVGAVLESHKNGCLDFSRLGPTEAKVLKKATALKPKHRFGSTSDFVNELRAAISAKPRKRLVSAVGNLIRGRSGPRQSLHDAPQPPPLPCSEWPGRSRNGRTARSDAVVGCAENELGVIAYSKRDFHIAAVHFENAVKCGYVRAVYNLGVLKLDIEQDEQAAIGLFWRAAAAGHDRATLYLARCYQSGRHGLPKDIEMAKKLLTRIVE